VRVRGGAGSEGGSEGGSGGVGRVKGILGCICGCFVGGAICEVFGRIDPSFGCCRYWNYAASLF
jgi:hypothetical protein